MKRQYRKPDGERTENVDVYLKSYEDLVTKIIRATGASIYSYDPGICLSFEGRTIELPVNFAKKLNEALGGR